LQPADGTALMAAHRDRQPSLAEAGVNGHRKLTQLVGELDIES